jgi:hypothetical protein
MSCNQQFEEWTTQIRQLDDKLAALQKHPTASDIPALPTDFQNRNLTNLAAVVDAVPNAQKSTFSACWWRRCSFRTGARSRRGTAYRSSLRFVHCHIW